MTPDATPPFDLTGGILRSRQGDRNRAREAKLGVNLRLNIAHILLRRANKIRTVHASCAVEGNTLTAEQVEAVPIEGRRVPGPVPGDPRGAERTSKPLNELEEWDPAASGDLKDLLTAC